jgi:hypothetical protein
MSQDQLEPLRQALVAVLTKGTHKSLNTIIKALEHKRGSVSERGVKIQLGHLVSAGTAVKSDKGWTLA